MQRFYLFLSFIILFNKGFTQSKAADTSTFIIIAAGPEYKKSRSFQKLWGRNWRTGWITPVRVPYLWLDRIDGGLTPSLSAGGNETKGLRLKSANGKEYALRSVNKSRDEVVPEEFRHTFIQNLIQDGVSMSHPYGAFALPVMAKSAGIYHAPPQLVYLPKQTALDSLNDKYGDDLYMFEQRLSGDWSDADNLGNFKEFLSTEEVVTKLIADNNSRADQVAFARVRLFDMLIADWDRHEDQWKWGERKVENRSVFIPIFKDRDQAFFVHNGFLIDKALSAIGNAYMQSFDYDSRNISALNLEERKMDPFFLNELTLDDWVKAAKDLQQALTDAIIEESIKGLPPASFAVSGKELIEKLRSRREHLVKYAADYYAVLAKEVEITGSKKKEYFEIRILETGGTSVKIFAIDSEGKQNEKPFYARIFSPNETKWVRLFGIGGEDVWSIDGKGGSIKISIIGGADKDSVVQHAGSNIHIYDDRQNFLHTVNAKFHFRRDSADHVFAYTGKKVEPGEYSFLNYSKKGVAPSFSYNDADRFYVGAGYGFTKYAWNKAHLSTKQLIDLHYSISQKAFSVTYKAEFPQLINNWDLFLFASYDAANWINFFGLGNETVVTTYNKNYFRMRTREWFANAGISRQFGKNSVFVSGFFQSPKIIADTGRYIAKVFLPLHNDAFEVNNYAGVKLAYTFLSLNDFIVPTKGITFLANASYFSNMTRKEFFQKYSGKLRVYIPFGNKFSLAIKAGGATTFCKPGILVNSAEFYEFAVIGGPEDLRGFRRERFWGKSSFYNTNELRFITNVRTHLLNAKLGLLVFFDDGRVWMPDENSNTLHTAYGTGILFAPFTKISATVTYGISKESRIFQVCLNKLF